MEVALIDAVWEGTPLEGAAGWKKAHSIGFEALDIAFDPVHQTPSAIDRYVGEVKSAPLPVRSVICVSLGIGGDYNRSVQQFHVDRAKQHLELGVKLNANNMLFVIGEYIWQQEIISADEQWQTAVRNVREVAQHAEDCGLKLALELEHWRYAFLNSIEAATRFLDDVGVAACQLNLDLNHLWAMKVDSRAIDQLSGRISHAHISDCHGREYENLPPGRGTAPLLDFLTALAATGFDGALSVELGPPPPPENIEEWVAEGYRETLRLMDAAGARSTRTPA